MTDELQLSRDALADKVIGAVVSAFTNSQSTKNRLLNSGQSSRVSRMARRSKAAAPRPSSARFT